MAQLTLEQHFKKMRRRAKALEKRNKPLEIGARTTHALITKRIFHDGNGPNGALGSYNTTTELWVADEDLRKKGTHRGKPHGLTKAGRPRKRGNVIKTSYYKNYKELKKQQGFTARVNFRLKNELQSDFANVELKPSSNRIPKPNTIKVDPNLFVIALRKQVNIDKMNGLKERFGSNVFNHSKKERKAFRKVVKKELIAYLSK